jgi:DNA-binding XRE family transcriptional regulator
MQHICAGQIKAARAFLDWSQEDLATITGLSLTTIRNLEMGYISPRNTTTSVVRRAIENAGLEFIDLEGIRRRLDEVKIYQGTNSVDMFFDDLLQTVQEKKEDIISVFKSPEMMMRLFSSINNGISQGLKQLSTITDVRCLIPETAQLLSLDPWLQCRTISMHSLGPTSYFVYGDNHALVLEEGGTAFRFVNFRLASLAQSYRNHFYSIWNESLSTPKQASSNKR